MAIVVRTVIESADQKAHDRLQAAIETRLQSLGGPPDGLMVHIGHPSGDGFITTDVWRSEEVFQWWLTEIMRPALDDAGLHAGPPEITAVWSLARP